MRDRPELFSMTSHQVHHKAGGYLITNPPQSLYDQGAELLPEEKSSDQNHIGIPPKTQMKGES